MVPDPKSGVSPDGGVSYPYHLILCPAAGCGTLMRFKTILATLSCACLVACGGANTDSQPTAKPHAFASTAAQAPQSAPEYAFVALPGKRNDYAITLSNAGYEVLYLPGPDGSQTFSGAPSLRFDDMTVNLGIGAQSQAIAPADLKLLIELYIAFFNRLPEADGLSFWIGRFMGGMPLAEIADHFFEAAAGYQGLTGYYREMTHTEFVKLIYRNVLGRDGATAPSSSEVQWWAGRLSSGSASRGLLVRTMLESAHSFAGHATYGWVSDFLDNKAIVGRYFAVQQGLGDKTREPTAVRRFASQLAAHLAMLLERATAAREIRSLVRVPQRR